MESGQLWASLIAEEPVRLYLGAGRDAQNLDVIRQHGVTHVLNCADDVPNFHEGQPGLSYLCLSIGDFGTDVGSRRTFADAARFCEAAAAGGASNAVLIHCANGSNRSATVTIAVLMQMAGMTLAQAWAVVHARRREAQPLQDNQQQLLDFEAAGSAGTVTMRKGKGGTLEPLAPSTSEDTLVAADADCSLHR